jgi:ketosteroid isomerase-like protein
MTEAGKATTTEQTERTLRHHLKAFGAGDLEAIMVDYADDALLITADDTFRGHEQIRNFFAGIFGKVFPQGWSSIKVTRQVVEGDLAYITWSGTSAAIKVPFATDTFLHRDGKIIAQTFAAVIEA